jgi:hypothetical protein
MTTKPRRLFRARSRGPASRFQQAMLQVVAEDLHASPCIACERPADFIGVWSPTPECIARELGGDPTNARQIVYRLCHPCAARWTNDEQFGTTVEDRILEVWRAGNVHRFKNGMIAM